MYSGFKEIIPRLWAHERVIWLREPIEDNKYFLVSWRMSGSEFCRELIRENFPECVGMNKWGKSHLPINDEIVNDLKGVGTKVFLIISDPRDVALNISYFDNGFHFYGEDYTSLAKNSVFHMLNETADKIINLIDHFKSKFGDDCLILRYEDALYHPYKFIGQVAEFLDLKPLMINDVRKYKLNIFKNVGNFKLFYDEDSLNLHFEKYSDFYNKWEYPINGLVEFKYNIYHQSEPYSKFLERNGKNKSMIKHYDKKLYFRIKNIHEF